jgi:hypothetical protein
MERTRHDCCSRAIEKLAEDLEEEWVAAFEAAAAVGIEPEL